MPAELGASLEAAFYEKSHVFYSRQEFDETYGGAWQFPLNDASDHVLDGSDMCGSWVTNEWSCSHVDDYCQLPETSTCEACVLLEGCGYCKREGCHSGTAGSNFVFDGEPACSADDWGWSAPAGSCDDKCGDIQLTAARGILRIGTAGLGEEYKAGQVCSWKIVADDLIAVDATVRSTGPAARVRIRVDSRVVQEWENTESTAVWSILTAGPVELVLEMFEQGTPGLQLSWERVNDAVEEDGVSPRRCGFECVAPIAQSVFMVFACSFCAGLFADRVILPYWQTKLERASQRQLIAVAVPPPDTTCSICLDGGPTPSWAKLPCGHAFHRPCIEAWFFRTQKCPLCRDEPARLSPFNRAASRTGAAVEVSPAPAETITVDTPAAPSRSEPAAPYVPQTRIE
jgi:hypothetical protein